MQVMIGNIVAQVSADGRDIEMQAPASAKDALALSFLQTSAKASSGPIASVASTTTAPDMPSTHAGISFDGRVGASLIFCLIIFVLAIKRYLDRSDLFETQQSRLHEELDDAAFLRRYGRRAQ